MVDTRKYNSQRNAYYKRAYRQMPLKLNLEKDRDVIEFLDTVIGNGGKNGYILRLIREDMKKRQAKTEEHSSKYLVPISRQPKVSQ